MKKPMRVWLSLCVALIVASSSISPASCSAIPMWEFLSRNEKMSHLFNTFVKQAAEYCKSSIMPDCHKVLLIHGLTNLAKMDDVSLDLMDPYERGANDRIWESMMKNGYATQQLEETQREQERERDNYADALETNSDENFLGSASNDVEQSVSVDNDNDNHNYNYMMGPMIVRVRADGSPIPDDQQRNRLPADEDMEEHMAMRSKSVPSMSELREFFSPAGDRVPSRIVAIPATDSYSPSPTPSPTPSHSHSHSHSRLPLPLPLPLPLRSRSRYDYDYDRV